MPKRKHLNDILNYLGIKRDKYHTLLTFLNVDWHKSQFIPSDEVVQKCKELIEKYGTGKELSHYIVQQNSLKNYGVTSVNKTLSKRRKSSQTLHNKYVKDGGWGGNQRGVNKLTSQEVEEKIKKQDLRMTHKYGENWKSLTRKDKYKISCLKNGITLETKTKAREENLYKKFPGFVIFNRYYNSNYFFHYLVENKFITEYKDIGRLHLVLERELCIPEVKKEYEKYQQISLHSGKSHYEQEIYDYLISSGIKNIVRNTRKIIHPKEIDIYLPDYKLGIEFNGLYWHSNEWKEDNSCLDKYALCKDKGIKLLQFYEDEWITKKEICKSIIKNNLELNNKVFAKNCIFKIVPKDIGKRFVDENHIHGSINGGNYYGLYYKDELIQVIQIGKPRFDKKQNAPEVLRMCTKLYTNVVGGFSKLLKHIPYEHLISYVDKRFFDGRGYEKCGWRFIKNCNPNYYYIVDNRRVSRLKYQKHKLKDKLKKYDESLSEKENMLNAGYHYIYDAGNYKYEWRKQK